MAGGNSISEKRAGFMPRPITKEAIKKLRKGPHWQSSWKLRKHKIVGYYLYDPNDNMLSHAYSLYSNYNFPDWVSKKDFQKRIKRGPIKPRKKRIKQIMREPDFGLDEMAIAERII